MLRAGRIAFSILAASLFASAAFAAHTHVPTPSTWTMIAKQSDFGGGPAMKSDVYVMLIDTEKWLKFTEVTVNGDGSKDSYSWSGAPDGKMHPLIGMHDTKAGFKSDDDSAHLILPDGTTVDVWMTYSADKKKVTNKVTVKDKAGHVFHQTVLYERTK